MSLERPHSRRRLTDAEDDVRRSVDLDDRAPERESLGGGGGGTQFKWGKLNGGMDGDDPDGTATVSIWDWNDEGTAWEDTEEDQANVYPPFLLAAGRILNSGTRVLITKLSDGKWYVINAEC